MPGATKGPTIDYFQRSVPFLGQFVGIYTVPTDIEGCLLAEDEVDRIFSSAQDLKCFKWRDSSFVMDRTVRTVRDVANSSKVRPLCAALDRS